MVKMKNRATKKQGRAFALAREARNLTQQQVAEAAGTNRPIVQRYEEGRSLPSDDGVLDRLHAVVGLSRRRRAPNEKGKRTGRLRRKVRQHKRDADSARAQKQADRADGRPTVATESSLFDGFPELQAEHRRVWAMWRGAYGAWVIAAWSLGALANKVERVRDEETVLRLAEEYGISKLRCTGIA